MLVNLNIRLSSVEENMNRVEEFVSNIMASFGIDVYHHGKIYVAVEEAVSNAIRYGNKNNPNKYVTVEFNLCNSYFDFSVADEGEGFDCNIVSNPISSDNEDESRGMFLMQTLSDELIFKDSGSKVIMRFYNNVKSIA